MNPNISSAQFQDGSSPAERYAQGLNALSVGNATFSAGPRGSTLTHVNSARDVDEVVRSGRPFVPRHRQGTERRVHAMVQNVTGEVFSPDSRGVRFPSVDEALRAAQRDGENVHWGGYLNGPR